MQSQQMPKHQAYNDGVLEYGEIVPIYDNARKKIDEKFSSIGKLMFEEMSKRDEDLLLANSLGYSLDLKLKTPKIPFKSKYKIKIDGQLYDVYKIDYDKGNTYLYCKVVGND